MVDVSTHRLPVLRAPLPFAGIEWVKCLAFVAMIIDHIGGLALHVPKFSWMYQVGRQSFPLFAIVLAYKLAVRTATGHDTVARLSRQMIVWTLVAQLPYALAAGRWLPLNIFFTLWLGCLACHLAVQPWTLSTLAGWVFIAAACPMADYGLSGVLLIVAAFCAVLIPTTREQGPRLDPVSIVAALLAMTMLSVGNESWWTFAALPVVFAVSGVGGALPVNRWFWYAIYPVHLMIIGLVRVAEHRIDWAHWFRPPVCLAKAARGAVEWAQCWL